jgi:hypothetical protein
MMTALATAATAQNQKAPRGHKEINWAIAKATNGRRITV